MEVNKIEQKIIRLMDELPFIYYINRSGTYIEVCVRDKTTRDILYEELQKRCNYQENMYIKNNLEIKIMPVSRMDHDGYVIEESPKCKCNII